MTAIRERIKGKSPVPALLLIAGWVLLGTGMAFRNPALILGGIAGFGLAGLSVVILTRRSRNRA
jgi:hypothetical protein